MPAHIKAHRIEFETRKTFATRANAIKAVEQKLGSNHEHFGSADVRWVVVATQDGRFLPVFLGEESIRAGLHFHFCCAA